MKRISSGTTPRRRTIDELDTDLLTTLEELDKRLYAVLSKTTRYRNILGHEIKRLRSGSAPEVVRALLLQWEPLRREIKRLADLLRRRAAPVFRHRHVKRGAGCPAYRARQGRGRPPAIEVGPERAVRDRLSQVLVAGGDEANGLPCRQR